MSKKFTDLMRLAENEDLPDRIKELRSLGLNAFIEGLNSVLPERLIKKTFSIEGNTIRIGKDGINRDSISEIIIVGGGKASAEMAKAIIKILDLAKIHIPFKGVINIPHEQTFSTSILSQEDPYKIEINFSSHPIPDQKGLTGVSKMVELIKSSKKDSLIICLISGGGSALMPFPAQGITLGDLQEVNKLMLQAGLEIQEINCIRKHLSAIKGGNLSKIANHRRLYSFIISDVIGNDLQTIASGPTVPDKTTFSQALSITKKYGIWERFPQNVKIYLERGERGEIEETPKPDSSIFNNTHNIIIGSAETSSNVVKKTLENQGIDAKIYTNRLEGQAREYGKILYQKIKNCKLEENIKIKSYIGTGEFTVTLHGNGKGGRNQEMLLSFLNEQVKDFYENSNSEKGLEYVIISGAFDGIEGNSPAMGAIIDSFTMTEIHEWHLEDKIEKMLDNNDSYNFFNFYDSTLITGYTGTNVNDMTLILVRKS